MTVKEKDNGNILFDHNVQIDITIYNSLKNQIMNWSEDYAHVNVNSAGPPPLTQSI